MRITSTTSVDGPLLALTSPSIASEGVKSLPQLTGYPASSGVRFTAAKKLQALRKQILEDKYISEELAYYVASNGQSFPSSEVSELLQPWVQKEFLEGDVRVLLLKGAGGA